MKIKEVSAGVKVSENYNSYSVNLVADVEENEDYQKVGNILIEKAMEVVNKKIKNNNGKEKEVGAAWYSKDYPGNLSVQYSKGGIFSEVEMKELEKSGFVQELNNEKYIFKRIPLENRKNNKMPVFRIYKLMEEND
ncbi:MAG: hypothetical protein NUV46_04885 [Nanoarchaeota archaeon]|nr:hypothetical protein [Nanoarchaeota archaeon]